MIKQLKWIKKLFTKDENVFKVAKGLFEYVKTAENGEIIKYDVHQFGGIIEGKIVTCKGVFYIKQVFIFKDDAIIKKEV